ncbi:MAG: hypothetical protein ACK4L8_14795 [Nitrincola lacisaponensis]|uniref:hypothetical protein n=1 Tax=Nitrincola lacisaponensis TaxID=267850 RepID=UPI00391986FB
MKIADWCVIGNGNRPVAAAPAARLTIGFNLPQTTVPFDMLVCNLASKGLAKKIQVVGPHNTLNWQQCFQAHAESIERQLGCWPSLGLVVVSSGVSSGLDLRVCNMNLLPTLSRPEDLPPRQVVPSHFHNWLGERRLILKLLSFLDWPEFTLPLPAMPHAGDTYEVCPLKQLHQLPELPKPLASDMITHLTTVDCYGWCSALAHTSPEELSRLDHLFMLDRKQPNTANWWLFDQHHSACMDLIRFQLAQAQQLLYV